MVEQDIFVGIVALATGLFVVASAVSNAEWLKRYWISRRLSESSNESVAKIVVLLIGFVCALLGVLLLLGFFPSSSNQGEGTKSHPDGTSSLHGRLSTLATTN